MIFIDFETQSTEDIKKVGGRKYLESPDTMMLSMVVKVNDMIYIWLTPNTSPDYIINPHNFEHELIKDTKKIKIYRSKSIPDEIIKATRNHVFCAHNAPFDKGCWDKFVGTTVQWYDTLPHARAGGYPGELDKLSLTLTGYGKDAGSAAMKLLTVVKIKAGKKIRPIGTKVLWEQLLQYNVVDVLLLEIIHEKVRWFGNDEYIKTDRAINEHGIYVDKKVVENLYALSTYNELKSKMEWDEITNNANPRSPKQVKDWLTSKGYKVDTLNRLALQGFFNNPEMYENDQIVERDDIDSIIEALRLRQEIVRVGRSKIERIHTLTSLETQRIYDQHIYYGAHTGRYSSRGLQIHNFARGRDYIDVEKLLRKKKISVSDIVKAAEEASKIAISKGESIITVSDVLGTLTRSCLCAEHGKILGIGDYGQIECRAVAWLAECTTLLEQFRKMRKGLDPYVYMAAKIFGIEPGMVTKEQRQLGKIVILACGYGMSAGKFDANCRIIYNVNLEAAGTSAHACVNSYRETYKEIAGNPRSRQGLWQRYNDAAHSAIITGVDQETGRCVFSYKDNTLFITLPSGRPLIYRNCSIQDRIPGYCKTLGLDPFTIPTIVYSHPHGYEGTLYGGLITENVAQAVSSDILNDSLVELEKYNMNTILHVHDEIVDELHKEKELDTQLEIMSLPSSWCKDFPILVEGYTCKWYSKSKFKSSYACEYLNGGKL